MLNGYSFFPSKLSLAAYSYLWQEISMITRSFGVSVFITVVGTTVSLIISSMLAYTLSRKDFPLRKLFGFMVFFTMLFNGGLVPTYIMYTQIFHIKDTIWSLIIPGLLMNGFNIMIMRTYFSTNVPDAILESAKVDGAGEFRTFFKIVLPLSLPIMATIGLLEGIAYWNDWFNGLIYITDQNLFSIQVVLNRIITDIQFLSSSNFGTHSNQAILPSVGIRMAIAVVGVIPIMAAYPFFQKYFVKGITIGAVKG
jgi:putative aldouronate transport system permease protein